MVFKNLSATLVLAATQQPVSFVDMSTQSLKPACLILADQTINKEKSLACNFMPDQIDDKTKEFLQN